MAHFGFLTLNVMGHLFPMSTLAHAVEARGHRVTFFCLADARKFLEKSGLQAVVVAEKELPLGFTKRVTDTLGTLNGSKGVAYTIDYFRIEAVAYFAALPDAIRAAGVEAMVIDQFSMGGATIGDYLKLPYVHVASALLINGEDGVPPINMGFGPERGLFASLRNRLTSALVKHACGPVRVAINEQRRAWGLPAYTEFFNERLSGGPQICQEPAGFEFPRKTLPANFHFVGPLHRRESRAQVSFPWERLDGRPVIYASMGTLQNGLDWIFRTFAEGCVWLDAQLVISLGGNLDAGRFKDLPGDPLVVGFAPQLEVLQRAAVFITHAGLNSALESLAQGVPMVAIPVTNDQPGVAARIAWVGAGRVLKLKGLTAGMVREAVGDVLGTPSYKQSAVRLQREILESDSLARACEVVESVLVLGSGAT